MTPSYVKYPALIIISLWFIGVCPAQAELIAQSGPQRTAMIELYSSEGCSSCVSAWQQLSKFENDSGLWTDFIPVDFRVEYWDYLGWKDKLADPRYTDRQRQYAALWNARNIYTPEFVFNGMEWRNWTQGIPQDGDVEEPGILTIEQGDGKTYKAVFQPAVGPTAYTAHFALLGSDLHTKVERGENRGRSFKAHFAVLDYQEVLMIASSGGQFTAQADLTVPIGITAGKTGIAVFITGRDKLVPLQAAGNYL